MSIIRKLSGEICTFHQDNALQTGHVKQSNHYFFTAVTSNCKQLLLKSNLPNTDCLPTVLSPHPHPICHLPVVGSPTHPALLESFYFCLFLLSGDIELNPGPNNFTLCTLNILHPVHSAALSDLIDSHNPDLFCLSETWIKPSTTSAELLHCTPPNYSLLSVPRNHSGTNPSNGGGTGFLIREPFTQLPSSVPAFSSFESSSVTLQLSRSKISILCRLHSLNLFVFSSKSSTVSSLRLLPRPMSYSSPAISNSS